jgi:hypothetical protein
MARTTLKIFAILILIGIIIGISVLKSSISAKRDESRIKTMHSEYGRARDSLLVLEMRDSTRFFADSLKNLERYYQDRIDSLNRLYGIVDSSTLEKTDQNALLTGTDVVKMIAEYDSLVHELPKHMTAAERKTALARLSTRLTRKYTLPADSVKRILDSGE